MKSISKGALTMMVAGAVTFSAANIWLGGPTKLFKKVKSIAHSEFHITAAINRDDKTMKHHPLTLKGKDIHSPFSREHSNHMALRIKNTSDPVSVQVVPKIENLANKTAPASPSMTTKTASKSTVTKVVPVSKSTKASNPATKTNSSVGVSHTTKTNNAAKTTQSKPTAPSSNPAPTTSHASTTSLASRSKPSKSTTQRTTTTTTNYGQQVSQYEKEKHTRTPK